MLKLHPGQNNGQDGDDNDNGVIWQRRKSNCGYLKWLIKNINSLVNHNHLCIIIMQVGPDDGADDYDPAY